MGDISQAATALLTEHLQYTPLVGYPPNSIHEVNAEMDRSH